MAVYMYNLHTDNSFKEQNHKLALSVIIPQYHSITDIVRSSQRYVIHILRTCVQVSTYSASTTRLHSNVFWGLPSNWVTDRLVYDPYCCLRSLPGAIHGSAQQIPCLDDNTSARITTAYVTTPSGVFPKLNNKWYLFQVRQKMLVLVLVSISCV